MVLGIESVDIYCFKYLKSLGENTALRPPPCKLSEFDQQARMFIAIFIYCNIISVLSWGRRVNFKSISRSPATRTATNQPAGPALAAPQRKPTISTRIVATGSIASSQSRSIELHSLGHGRCGSYPIQTEGSIGLENGHSGRIWGESGAVSIA